MKRREGSCIACRLRRSRGHEAGDACEVCARTDRRVLRRHRLRDVVGGEVLATLCALCSCVAGRRPLTLAELVAEVRPTTDRRQLERRAGGDRRRRVELHQVEHRRTDRRAAA